MNADIFFLVLGSFYLGALWCHFARGIAIIENEVRNSLTRAFRLGILAAPPAKADVTVPTAASIDATTKATRRLPNVRFTAVTSGAIHSVDIVGQVS